MKKAVQVLAGVNAVFQGAVGLLSVASPATAAEVFKLGATAPATLGLIRMFGGLLAASGIVSGFIARDPERDPALVRGYAAGLALNVLADVVAIAAGEMRFGQLAAGMVLEVLLAGALLAQRQRSVAGPVGQPRSAAA